MAVSELLAALLAVFLAAVILSGNTPQPSPVWTTEQHSGD